MSSLIGVDIGTYTIKIATAKGGGKDVVLESLASVYNPTGQFLPTDAVELQKLASTIKTAFSEQSIKGGAIYVCLPESMAYTNVVSMPFLSEAELSSSIHWEAEQHIPVPLKDVNLEYEVLYKPKKEEVGEKMRVLLVAARKEVVDRLVNLFSIAGLEVVGLETTLLGVYRALRPVFVADGLVMACHMGALTTDILIVENGSLVLSYSIQSGGLALTRAIERGLGLLPGQAEEYKQAYGMDPKQLEGKLRQVLIGVMNVLVGEIRKAMQYYQTSRTMNPIRSLVVTGGTAYLPGIVSFLAESFSFEVVIGNPLEGVSVKPGLQVPKDIGVYTPVIGLCMQENN